MGKYEFILAMARLLVFGGLGCYAIKSGLGTEFFKMVSGK